MQRMGFLKQIQQKNDNSDLRKLSLLSISTNGNDQQKGVFIIEPPNYHSQMPAFINRKVKNLKPYTNHFKRFNVQATKIQQIGTKNTEVNKLIKVSLENDKIKIGKSSVLKQLGIERQIKPIQIVNKLSEISVYDQFLEKTNNLLSSNLIESMYQQCVKKNQKFSKQSYQRSHRITNSKQSKQGRQKIIVPRQQRRSMGGVTQTNQMQFNDGKKSIYGIKSMDQLPKSQQGVIRSDKVCIIPNLVNIQNDDFILNQGIKYVASLKKKNSIIQTAQSFRKNTLQTNHDKAPNKLNVSNQKKSLCLLNDNLAVAESSQTQKTRDTSANNPQSPNKSDIQSKSSPLKQQKNLFSLNIGLKQKQSQKNSQTQKININKSQKEVTTINVDKIKPKSNVLDVPFPTNVTACSYIVYEPSFSQNQNFSSNQENLAYTNKVFSNQRILASLNCKTVLQIASLTKIMTFILALEICQNLKIDSTVQKVRIGKFEAHINGTSAELKQGQIYTVEQLYYGLMLPSGNDASLALATWGGKKMLIREIKQKQKIKKKSLSQNIPLKSIAQTDPIDVNLKSQNLKIVLKKKRCYDRFILQMNKKARSLGMTKTTYANSHGLSNNLNKSCAFDLCILCQYAMLNEKFKKVVSTTNYQSTILYEEIQDEESQIFQGNFLKRNPYLKNESNDDIEHNNGHSDEQSSEQIELKQVQKSQGPNSQRQKRFYNSQTNFSTCHKDRECRNISLIYKQRQIFWQNTHKLLSRQDYIGIKTGITNTAGPCLASCIKTLGNRFFIIIVLNSKKINYRFRDTETLRKWVYKRQGIPSIKVHKPQTQTSLACFKNEVEPETYRNSDHQLIEVSTNS